MDSKGFMVSYQQKEKIYNMKNNNLNESFMRKNTMKQMKKLNKQISAAGGDIGANSNTDSENNLQYMSNPFNSNRHIDTYEHYIKNDAIKRTKTDKMNDSKFGNVTQMKDDVTKVAESKSIIPKPTPLSGADIKGIATIISKQLKDNETPKESDIKKLLPKVYKDISDDEFESVLSALVALGVDIDLKVDEAKKTKSKKKSKTIDKDFILNYNDFSKGDVIYMDKLDKDRPMFINHPDNKEAE